MKKVEARLRKKGRCKPYSGRRSIRQIHRDENPAVRGLVRIADDEYRLPNLPQQTPEGGVFKPAREPAPLMPAGHDKVDAMALRPRRNGAGRISDADVDAVRQLVTPQPSANFSLELVPGVTPLCFNGRSRSSAIDDVKDGQVAFPFERQPGRSHESDLTGTREVMREEHPIPFSGEVRRGTPVSSHCRQEARRRSSGANGCWVPMPDCRPNSRKTSDSPSLCAAPVRRESRITET